MLLKQKTTPTFSHSPTLRWSQIQAHDSEKKVFEVHFHQHMHLLPQRSPVKRAICLDLPSRDGPLIQPERDRLEFCVVRLGRGQINFPSDHASKGSPEVPAGRGRLPADRQAHCSEIAPFPCPGPEERPDVFGYE